VPNNLNDAPWQDLAGAGFVTVREFLSELELAKLRNDYDLRFGKPESNGNYDAAYIPPLLTWQFEPKLRAVSSAVQAASGITADMTVGGLYFATTRGVSFPWHQDHDSFFIYQQHSDYLNFYIPIVKPSAKLSNLCLIPFDRLRERVSISDFERLRGSGAARFVSCEGGTRVFDDGSDDEYTLPVDIESLKATPELMPGDLLLFRGDMIHRTQDADTARVAVSFRRTRSAGVIRKDKLQSGGTAKQDLIRKSSLLYESLFKCFASLNQDEMTAKQLAEYYQAEAAKRAKRS